MVNSLMGKWGSFVLLFFLMAFMGATLWVSTVIPAHNAKRLQEIQKILDDRSVLFEELHDKLEHIEKVQNERLQKEHK